MKKLLYSITALIITLSGYSQTAQDYLDQGNARANLQDFKGAIDNYTKSLNINTNNPSAYYMRGFAKNWLEDYRGAIEDFTKSIDIVPASATYYLRACAKINLKDYYSAIDDFNKAIDIDPKDPKTYYNRGIAKNLIGQKDSGCLDLSKAGELGLSQAYESIQRYCK